MSDFQGNDDFDEVIELTGDAGDVLKFIHIGTIEYKGGKYVFFQSAETEDDEDDDEVVVFAMGKENGEDVLLPIDDDDLMTEVYEEFMRLYDIEENENCSRNCNACNMCSTCPKCAKDIK